MLARRSVLPLFALAVAACSMFKPIDPGGSKPKPEPKPSEPKAAPATKAPGDKAPAPSNTKPAAPTPIGGKQRSWRDQRGDVNDRNIAAMVMALNNTDISYARLAPSRADRNDVKEFSARMLTDHTGVNGLVKDLLTKLDIEPEDNTASLDMRDESANRRDAMRDLTGFPFDSTYIENEVNYHQKFLVTIDSLMLPAAKNSDLKGLLTAVRPAVAAHLAHAEQVRVNVISRK